MITNGTTLNSSDWLRPTGHYSLIDGDLWQGGWPGYDAAEGHRRFEFVFDLYGKPHHAPRAGQHITIYPFMDGPSLPPVDRLVMIADQVRACRKLGPTLVHCEAGWNRSGLIVALALIRDGWYPSTAIAHIREKRCAEALSNATFAKWLCTLEPGAPA